MKKAFSPIELNFYDQDNEIKETHTLSVVRWGVLKKAVKLSESIQQGTMGEEEFDAVSAFVCFMFGDRFTPKDLEEHAEIGEIMTCFRQVVNRANQLGNA